MENKLTINLSSFADHIKNRYNSNFPGTTPTFESYNAHEITTSFVVKKDNNYASLISFHASGTIIMTEDIYSDDRHTVCYSEFETFIKRYDELY